MNKERKVTLTVIAEVLKAGKTAPSRHVERALERGITSVLASEQRARRAMEGFKDEPGTAANHRNAVASISHLEQAIEALVDQDVAAAVDHLEGAIDPASRQVHKPTRKAR